MDRIAAPNIVFNEEGTPFSSSFGDVYFAPGHGLAETQTVYLEANHLPHRWQDAHAYFTIAETGFGTGLNFLATCQMFRQSAGQPGHKTRHLHFISVERYPLSRDQLRQALQPWQESFGPLVSRLIDTYPLRLPGFHRVHFAPDITLTLIFDDALAAYRGLEASVDAWFLDGFSPSKNPQMWGDALYAEMARLSHAGTTLASFTAVGNVRRGLKAAGFTIKRQKGFRYKYHRTTGQFDGPTKAVIPVPGKVAIIGAGLMGATLADALRRSGIGCTVFDRKSGPGLNASGNRLGLINPKIDLGHDAVGDLGSAIYTLALQRLRDMPDIGLQAQGSFHAATDAVKAQRQNKIADHWLPGPVRRILADETEELTGMALPHDGLFFPDSVTVNTGLLVQRMLENVDIRWNSDITDLDALRAEFDHVVIANSEAALRFQPSLRPILQPMRGQVTYVEAPVPGLRCPIVAGHYVAPVDETTWVTGATFQRERTDIAVSDADDTENIAALHELVPGLGDITVKDRWAQVRWTTPDRRPVLGNIAPDVTLATALGSHGLQYGFLLAEIVTARLTGAPMPVSADVLKILDLNRYADRMS